MKYIHLILLIGLLTIAGCYQDQDDSVVVISSPVPVPETETDIEGSLVEPNNDSAENNYRVVINERQFDVVSDHFLIENVKVKKQGQLMEAFRGDKLIGLCFHHLIEFDLNRVELITIDEIEQTLISQGDGFETDLGLVKISFKSSISSQSEQTIFTSTLDKISAQRAFGSTAYSFDTDGEPQLLSVIPQYGFTIKAGDNLNLTNNNIQFEFDDSSAGQVLFHYSTANQQWQEVAPQLGTPITVTELGYYMVA